MNGELRDLYQDVVIDHSKQPRNFRKLDDATGTAEGFNPPSARTFDYPKLKIHTAVGYDAVTGMGVPNGAAFLDALP